MSDFSTLAAASAAIPAPPRPEPPHHHLTQLASLDLSSRADSANSALSDGSTSGGSEQAGQLAPAGSGCSYSFEADADKLAADAALGGGARPVKKDDAKNSALKALAGVSAIVSKSRRVDAEALQAIKTQRAKARAEGHPPAAPSGPSSGRATPPPPAPLAAAAMADAGGGPSASPFASATSQGLVRAPSASNLAAAIHSVTQGLSQATSLPIGMHGQQRQRRSPGSTPPASAADYDFMVNKMTITELVALKQAVEAQLAKQAMALAQLQASTHNPQIDMLSQQYAALLLQNAQQQQLVQQLTAQQQVTHAAAIQQALSAAASAAGITSSSFSSDQLMLSTGQQSSSSMAQYGSLPLPDMSSPFASAPYPADAMFGLGGGEVAAGMGGGGGNGGGSRVPVGRQPAPSGPGGGVPLKASGSPRSASAEQQLIGEALHSFVDPERQGPASCQGSALVNGINWSDRRTTGVPLMGGGGGPPGAGSPDGASFARSRSLPHPQDSGLYQDRSVLTGYLGENEQQMQSLFNGLRMDGLPPANGSGAPPSAFAAARGGSLQAPLQRVSFSNNVQTHTFPHGY